MVCCLCQFSASLVLFSVFTAVVPCHVTWRRDTVDLFGFKCTVVTDWSLNFVYKTQTSWLFHTHTQTHKGNISYTHWNHQQVISSVVFITFSNICYQPFPKLWPWTSNYIPTRQRGWPLLNYQNTYIAVSYIIIIIITAVLLIQTSAFSFFKSCTPSMLVSECGHASLCLPCTDVWTVSSDWTVALVMFHCRFKETFTR